MESVPYHPTGKGQARYVVCAAIRLRGGLIICGARHFDPIMTNVLAAMIPDGSDWCHLTKGCEQGFIDQYRNFLTRKQAWKLAKKMNQIRYDCGGQEANGGTLFSENLY